MQLTIILSATARTILAASNYPPEIWIVEGEYIRPLLQQCFVNAAPKDIAKSPSRASAWGKYEIHTSNLAFSPTKI